jgi:hypothetical protein
MAKNLTRAQRRTSRMNAKGSAFTNKRRENATMANGNGNTSPTKADLQDQIDDAIETLEAAYVPESSREELVEAISGALNTLRGEDEDDQDDDDLD